MIGDAMLVTTCPDCKTTFRVSVGILEKAAGQVRCGRCSSIFNANGALEEIADLQSRSSDSSSFKFELQPEQDLAVDFIPGWGEDDEQTDADVPGALSYEDIEWVDEEESADDAEPEDEQTTATDDEPEPEPEPEPEHEIVLETPGESEADDESEAETEAEAAEEDSAEPESEPDDDTDAETESAPEQAGKPDWLTPVDEAPRRSRLWSVAAVLLLLTLAGQLIHQYRSELVAVPELAPAVTRVYELLGREVSPVPDLGQYDLMDLTAVAQPTSDEQGWLMIETRVRNGGPRPQPYPYIFVRLLDRWEDTIAGRYFAPDEYAVSPIRNSAQMSTGSTIDAQFVIMDPGPSATGFELELCVAADNGYLCESDIVND